MKKVIWSVLLVGWSSTCSTAAASSPRGASAGANIGRTRVSNAENWWLRSKGHAADFKPNTEQYCPPGYCLKWDGRQSKGFSGVRPGRNQLDLESLKENTIRSIHGDMPCYKPFQRLWKEQEDLMGTTINPALEDRTFSSWKICGHSRFYTGWGIPDPDRPGEWKDPDPNGSYDKGGGHDIFVDPPPNGYTPNPTWSCPYSGGNQCMHNHEQTCFAGLTEWYLHPVAQAITARHNQQVNGCCCNEHWGNEQKHHSGVLDAASGWCPQTAVAGAEWMQMDFGKKICIKGIVNQARRIRPLHETICNLGIYAGGRSGIEVQPQAPGRNTWLHGQAVVKYSVKYSEDGTTWTDLGKVLGDIVEWRKATATSRMGNFAEPQPLYWDWNDVEFRMSARWGIHASETQKQTYLGWWSYGMAYSFDGEERKQFDLFEDYGLPNIAARYLRIYPEVWMTKDIDPPYSGHSAEDLAAYAAGDTSVFPKTDQDPDFYMKVFGKGYFRSSYTPQFDQYEYLQGLSGNNLETTEPAMRAAVLGGDQCTEAGVELYPTPEPYKTTYQCAEVERHKLDEAPLGIEPVEMDPDTAKSTDGAAMIVELELHKKTCETMLNEANINYHDIEHYGGTEKVPGELGWREWIAAEDL